MKGKQYERNGPSGDWGTDPFMKLYLLVLTMPRLEELATLCKVIEQKGFSRAAELLGLS